jgi:hypothetical protein
MKKIDDFTQEIKKNRVTLHTINDNYGIFIKIIRQEKCRRE